MTDAEFLQIVTMTKSFPIWSPWDAHEAAAILTLLLEDVSTDPNPSRSIP